MCFSLSMTVFSNTAWRWVARQFTIHVTFLNDLTKSRESLCKTNTKKEGPVTDALVVSKKKKRSRRLDVLLELLDVSLGCRDSELTPIKEITSQFTRKAEVLHAGDLIWQGYQMPGREGTTSKAFKWPLKSVFTTQNVSTHRPVSELRLRHRNFCMCECRS